MSEHILLVDDDEIVLTGLASNLEEQGFKVTTASTSAEAIRLAETFTPDLMLCDLVLDELNGIELMRRLHEQHPDTGVILITGHGSIGNAMEALRSGAADYIQKPADPDEVVHRIRTVLNASNLRHALDVERNKLEQQRQTSNQNQARQDRMSAAGLMAEGAAHAMTDILRPVIAFAPAIQEGLPLESPLRAMIEEMAAAGLRAESLINDFGYIGTGGVSQRTDLDVGALLQGFLVDPWTVSLRAARPDLSIQINVADLLPAVRGSAQHLLRAIQHLVEFCAEVLPEKGCIAITAEPRSLDRAAARDGAIRPGDYVVLSVADNGPGLSVEDLDRLFDPFYTLRMGRRISGLALPFVYRVMLDHDGTITAAGAPGRGVDFSMFLPAVGAALDEPVRLRPDYSGGETILLVDDHVEHRREAAAILVQLGYHVVECQDGRQAVQEFERSLTGSGDERIDLAVIDLVLGDEFDGVEVFRKITEARPRQRAILASGFADTSRISEAKRMGMTRCIQKPYTSDILGKAVREALDEL